MLIRERRDRIDVGSACIANDSRAEFLTLGPPVTDFRRTKRNPEQHRAQPSSPPSC
jgi:hypothetical protein